MGNFRIGTNPNEPEAGKLKLGTADISKIYKGGILVWPASDPNPDPYDPIIGTEPYFIAPGPNIQSNFAVVAYDEDINPLSPPDFASPNIPSSPQPWAVAAISDNYEVMVLAGNATDKQVYLSNDSGVSWFQPAGVFTQRSRVRMSKNGETIVLRGTTANTLPISTDFGATFVDRAPALEALGPGSPILQIVSTACSGSGKYIYASVRFNFSGVDDIVCRSADYGATWSNIIEAMPGSRQSLGDIAVSGNGQRVIFQGLPETYAETTNSFSTDYGVTWTESTYQGDVESNNDLKCSSNGLIVGASGGTQSPAKISYDGGNNWQNAPGISQQGTEAMYISNSGQFCFLKTQPTSGADAYDACISTDGGQTFTCTGKSIQISPNLVLIDKGE